MMSSEGAQNDTPAQQTAADGATTVAIFGDDTYPGMIELRTQQSLGVNGHEEGRGCIRLIDNIVVDGPKYLELGAYQFGWGIFAPDQLFEFWGSQFSFKHLSVDGQNGGRIEVRDENDTHQGVWLKGDGGEIIGTSDRGYIGSEFDILAFSPGQVMGAGGVRIPACLLLNSNGVVQVGRNDSGTQGKLEIHSSAGQTFNCIAIRHDPLDTADRFYIDQDGAFAWATGVPAFTDGVATSGSPKFTSLTANFTAADVGVSFISPLFAGDSTILSVQSATQVAISGNASATGTAQTFTVGRSQAPIISMVPSLAASGGIQFLGTASTQAIVVTDDTSTNRFTFGMNGTLTVNSRFGGAPITAQSAGNIVFTVSAAGGIGLYGQAVPAQPARCVTLDDVIAVLAGNGMTA